MLSRRSFCQVSFDRRVQIAPMVPFTQPPPDRVHSWKEYAIKVRDVFDNNSRLSEARFILHPSSENGLSTPFAFRPPTAPRLHPRFGDTFISHTLSEEPVRHVCHPQSLGHRALQPPPPRTRALAGLDVANNFREVLLFMSGGDIRSSLATSWLSERRAEGGWRSFMRECTLFHSPRIVSESSRSY